MTDTTITPLRRLKEAIAPVKSAIAVQEQLQGDTVYLIPAVARELVDAIERLMQEVEKEKPELCSYCNNTGWASSPIGMVNHCPACGKTPDDYTDLVQTQEDARQVGLQ